MKIVRQLADWLLQNDRITPERYGHVLDAILDGVDADAGSLIDAAVDRRDRRESAEDASEEWWNLHGAGERARGKAARRRGGGGHPADTTPVKVWDLDPRLPGLLFPPGAAPDAFPLATLFLAVDKARGNRRAADWDGFAAAAAALYKAGGDELHDALRVAMEKRGRALGPLLAAMETGATLFPDGFLDDLSGESVAALRKRVDGGETAFSFAKADWILRYTSFNILNEACLVRNRLRRVYRLWVQTFADWDEHGAANRCVPVFFLSFGKLRVAVPLCVWWRMARAPAPARCFPSLNVLAVEKATAPVPDQSDPLRGCCLNFTLDGRPVLAYRAKGTDTFMPAKDTDGPILTWQDDDFWFLRPVENPGSCTPRIAPPVVPDQVWLSPKQLVDTAPNNLEHLDHWPWETLLTDGIPMNLYCGPGFKEGWLDYVNCRLAKNPKVVDRIGWSNLSEETRQDLFLRNPNDFPCDWFSGADWSSILCTRPDLDNRCDWSKLSGFDWSLLLRFRPDLADHCDWSKLDGFNWSRLLSSQPQFADRCDWRKLSVYNWRPLLEAQPQLAIHRPFRRRKMKHLRRNAARPEDTP